MNKELTPLQALENLKNLSHDVQYASKIPCIDKELDIIETALKRLENLEEEKQSFDRKLEKKLKSLEIIKEKRIIIDDFITCSELWIYNQFKPEWKQLTEEEYDLLKEALS